MMFVELLLTWLCFTTVLGGTCLRRFNFEQLGTAVNGPRYDTAIDGDFGDRRFDHLINDGTPITADKEIELGLRFSDHGSTMYEMRVVLVGAKEVYISLNGNTTPKFSRPGQIEEWVFVYRFPSDITNIYFYTSPGDDGIVFVNQFDISGCIIKKQCPTPWSSVPFDHKQQDNFLMTSSAGGNPWDIVLGSRMKGVYTEDTVFFTISGKFNGLFDLFKFAVSTRGVRSIYIEDYQERITIIGGGWRRTAFRKERFMASEVTIHFGKMEGADEMKIRVMFFKMCALLNGKK